METTDVKYPAFGSELRRIMAEKQIKAPAVAARLDCSPQMVRRYMEGDAMPNAERLIKLAAWLGVPVQGLLADIEQPGAPPAEVRPKERTRDYAQHLVDEVVDDFGFLSSLRLLYEPIAVGPYGPFSPDLAIAGPDGWVAAIEFCPATTRWAEKPNYLLGVSTMLADSVGYGVAEGCKLYAVLILRHDEEPRRVERLAASLDALIARGRLAKAAMIQPRNPHRANEAHPDALPDRHTFGSLLDALRAFA